MLLRNDDIYSIYNRLIFRWVLCRWSLCGCGRSWRVDGRLDPGQVRLDANVGVRFALIAASGAVMAMTDDSDLSPDTFRIVHHGSTVVETRADTSSIRTGADGVAIDQRIRRFFFALLVGDDGRVDHIQRAFIGGRFCSYFSVSLFCKSAKNNNNKPTVVGVSTTPSGKSHHLVGKIHRLVSCGLKADGQNFGGVIFERLGQLEKSNISTRLLRRAVELKAVRLIRIGTQVVDSKRCDSIFESFKNVTI